jgi:hypothetical protein
MQKHAMAAIDIGRAERPAVRGEQRGRIGADADEGALRSEIWPA